jgi:hypothetical protein
MNISKLQADIQLKQDILNFLNEGGAVKVCKASKPRKSEVTFRNNKYTIFNMGHQKACGRGFMNGTANLPAFGIVKGL